mmetsp:Transcript_29709/g.81162  ORF Transcript_29709/g.81162 Transcript_29709/m.81162 type:complete len:88 (+) Transcript_29709:2-265(+)
MRRRSDDASASIVASAGDRIMSGHADTEVAPHAVPTATVGAAAGGDVRNMLAAAFLGSVLRGWSSARSALLSQGAKLVALGGLASPA